jgi:hypothetical protein
MKQTAVEWLFEQYVNKSIITIETLKKAKEMEKEQHEETFKQSRLAKIFEKDMPPVWESWEQYYNETFKTK